ncbi:fibronectin type III-like domain-contianing protein [Mycobacterium bohemicum]|uniref:fibronectin type III-like domain-contianing protein n=1 Tax=Mycobacterium bohemicum TaxID=56425 RepID=UPI003D178050
MPQLYLTDAPDGPRLRLLGFRRVELAPGESRRVSIEAMGSHPRLDTAVIQTVGAKHWDGFAIASVR